MATMDLSFLSNMLNSTSILGMDWLIPTAVAGIALAAITIDSEEVKSLAFPLFYGFHTVGLRQNFIVLLILGIIYVQEGLSINIAGTVLQGAKQITSLGQTRIARMSDRLARTRVVEEAKTIGLRSRTERADLKDKQKFRPDRNYAEKLKREAVQLSTEASMHRDMESLSGENEIKNLSKQYGSVRGSTEFTSNKLELLNQRRHDATIELSRTEDPNRKAWLNEYMDNLTRQINRYEGTLETNTAVQRSIADRLRSIKKQKESMPFKGIDMLDFPTKAIKRERAKYVNPTKKQRAKYGKGSKITDIPSPNFLETMDAFGKVKMVDPRFPKHQWYDVMKGLGRVKPYKNRPRTPKKKGFVGFLPNKEPMYNRPSPKAKSFKWQPLSKIYAGQNKRLGYKKRYWDLDDY